MKVLKVFVDFADAIEELNDAERGRLFMAMLEYARSGAAPVFRGAEKVLWPVAKGNIDNQRRAYEHVCAVNKSNVTTRYGSLRTATNRSESKQDKEKEKIKKFIDDDEEEIEDLLPRAREDDDLLRRYDAADSAIRIAFMTHLGRAPVPGEAERLKLSAVTNGVEKLLASAIARAAWNGAKSPAGYAVKLLEEWAGQGLRDESDLIKYDRIMHGARDGDYSATEALREIQRIKEG